MSNRNSICLDTFLDDSSSTSLSDTNTTIPKRRRSVVDGCKCDLDALPERFVLFKIEKELSALIEEYGDKKFYELDKYDWLKFKRTLKEFNEQIKQLKDN